MYLSTAKELHSQVSPISGCLFIPVWVTPVPTGMSEVCVSRELLCKEKMCGGVWGWVCVQEQS